jgi:hypothetical protein
MWQNKMNGLLGIWIIALSLLGFSESLQRILLIFTGVVIAAIAFRGEVLIQPTRKLLEKTQEVKTKEAEGEKVEEDNIQ